MKYLILFAGLAALLFLTTSSCKNLDSGPKTSKEYTVSEFSNLNLEVVGDIYYEQSDDHYMKVSGGSNLIENLIVENEDGNLSIKLKDKNRYSSNKNNLVIRLGSPQLESVKFNSVGEFQIKDHFKGEKLMIVNNGVGEIEIDDCELYSFNLVSNGIGQVEVKGSSEHTFINSQGVGSIDCSKLKSQNTIVECQGIGSISAYASKSIDLSIMGIGNVKYYGNPDEIKQNISGMGKATNMN